jgi:hypothetical protein
MNVSMARIEIECGRCGHQYPVSREQIVKGSWRRACPVCFAQEDGGGEAKTLRETDVGDPRPRKLFAQPAKNLGR